MQDSRSRIAAQLSTGTSRTKIFGKGLVVVRVLGGYRVSIDGEAAVYAHPREAATAIELRRHTDHRNV